MGKKKKKRGQLEPITREEGRRGSWEKEQRSRRRRKKGTRKKYRAE